MKHSPFELNEINNYLWNRQGKRHYWGIKGKDYGLLESLSNNKTNIDESNNLQLLKNRHLNLNQQYDERIGQRISQTNRKPEYEYHENPYLEDMQKYRNQYSTERPLQNYKIRTQPIESYENQRQSIPNSSEAKRRHLSLMSKNIEVSNRQAPVADNSKRFSSFDYAEQKDKQQLEVQKKIHKRVNTDGNINDNQMKKYRERIVKVVKRDRKNNPTFCNSLAYPLHCYRYVQ